MPQLRVMFFNDHLQEVIVQPSAFIGGHVVDALHVVPDSVQAFPPRDGIGAHDRVDSRERLADVVGGSARLGVKLEALLTSRDR